MSMTNLRRMAALLGSAALLASMTVATVAAPAAAGKCLPFEYGVTTLEAPNCYYATEPLTDLGLDVPAGVTLSGTNEDDRVRSLEGVFNGRGGSDAVFYVQGSGTFNGGKGDDMVLGWISGDGTFNGGPGDDCAYSVGDRGTDGTFAGGSGSDTYRLRGLGVPTAPGIGYVWSAVQVPTSCATPS